MWVAPAFRAALTLFAQPGMWFWSGAHIMGTNSLPAGREPLGLSVQSYAQVILHEQSARVTDAFSQGCSLGPEGLDEVHVVVHDTALGDGGGGLLRGGSGGRRARGRHGRSWGGGASKNRRVRQRVAIIMRWDRHSRGRRRRVHGGGAAAAVLHSGFCASEGESESEESGGELHGWLKCGSRRLTGGRSACSG